MSNDLLKVIMLVEEWSRAWLDLNVDAMTSLFDNCSNDIVYLAEENDDAAFGIEGVRRYWNHTKDNVLAAVLEWEIQGEPSVVFPCDNLALVWLKVTTLLAMQGLDPAVAGTLRVSMGVRRTPVGWRIVHYHESRHLFPKGDLGPDYAFTTDIRLTDRETSK